MALTKCLCEGCSNTCSGNTKNELALRGVLTYIYLRRGGKLTNTCKLYSTKKSIATALTSTIPQFKPGKPAFKFVQ